MSISKPVGRASVNLKSDVRTIQLLINSARITYTRLGSTIKPLEVDGNCGPLTINAIEAFQRIVMQLGTVDGVVEPNRNTWKRLNSNAGAKKSLSGASSFQKPKVESFIQWFTGAATDNLTSLHRAYRAETDRILGIKKPQMSAAETKKISSFSQADSRWATNTLGNGKGSSATFRASGCALVCLTMAATYLGSATTHWPKDLKPNQLNPIKVNDIFKKAGVFTVNSFAIFITGGAKSLGMIGVDSGRGQKLATSHRQTIDTCLRSGGLVMLHVDYKKDDDGDHWVLLTQRNATGEYTAIDPAYGKEISFASSPESGTTIKHVLLYGKSQQDAKNAGSYKVVRYVTLNAA